MLSKGLKLVGMVSLLAMFAVASFTAPSAGARQGSVEEFPNAIPGGPGGAVLRLAAGPDGQMWATETGGKVVRFSPTGAVTGEFGLQPGVGPGVPKSSHPEGIAVDKNGDVWFTDSGTDDEGHAFVGRISSSYAISEFPIPVPGLIPRAIAEGSDGNLWFTEAPSLEGQSGYIGRITPDGTITEIKNEDMIMNTSVPGAIALGADGDMWFTDDGTSMGYRGAIGRITPAGSISEFVNPTLWGFPNSIALGGDGNMWYTESEGHVVRITPQGDITLFPVVTTGPSLGGIALGPDGNMWFAEDERTNTISRISPSGAVTEFSPVAPGHGYPTAIAFDTKGDIWFGEASSSKVGRWITPRVAVNESQPELSGSPMEGQALTASPGSWAFEPDSYTYQWQSCTAVGDRCGDLAGETASVHYLTGADVGHTLRVVVTAVSLGGSASVTSAFSNVVLPMPLQPRTSQAIAGLASVPTVEATMTWRFAWSRRYTVVKSLVVHAAPDGASIEVRCLGRNCAFARRRIAIASGSSCHGHDCPKKALVISHGQLGLTGLFKGRHLMAGTRISVAVTRPGWTGKLFDFVTRTGRRPSTEIRCLVAGTHTLDKGC